MENYSYYHFTGFNNRYSADSAAVALKFWVYESKGFFYGVPLMNFLGWIFSGLLSSIITMLFVKDKLNDLNKPKALVPVYF